MKKLTTPILLVGTPEEHPDLEYISGFRAPDPIVFLVTAIRHYLVVSSLEYGRAKRVFEASRRKTPTDVLTPEMLGLRRSQRRRISHWALGVVHHAGLKRVRVPGVFPVGVADVLKRQGIRVTPSTDPLFPERDVKRADEVRMITESQQAATLAMRSAIGMIAGAAVDGQGRLTLDKKPLTSERVQTRVREVLFAHESFCRDVIVAGGRQGADPHEQGRGPLYAGQPIVIDIFPRHLRHGYWGDLTRTVVKGQASPELRRMYDAVSAAQSRALDLLRPRVQCATVHEAVCDEFRARGYATGLQEGLPQGFIHSTGHGVGLAIHESPSLAPSTARLRSGHVVTVEPGLYYAALGGIRIEDTVLVTPDGWRALVPCEKRFEV